MSRFASLFGVLVVVAALAGSGCLGGAQPEPPTGGPSQDGGVAMTDAGSQTLDASAGTDADIPDIDGGMPAPDASTNGDASVVDGDVLDGDLLDGDILDGDLPDGDVLDGGVGDADTDAEVDAGLDADVDATPPS